MVKQVYRFRPFAGKWESVFPVGGLLLYSGKPVPGRDALRDPRHPLSGNNTSVKDDWRAYLPVEKSRAFCAYVHELESSYGMLSVSLNEALELRQNAQLHKSCQAVNFTPQLCSRLTTYLASLIRVLGQHAKHYGTVPNTAPLDAENFVSARSQRSARMSGLLSKVLLSQRTQFLHKLGTLQEMVEELGKDYCDNAEELGAGTGTNPTALWQIIDAAHYDLNTCLRETIVLLKSFLRALPDDQLGGFEKAVAGAWAAQSRSPRPSTTSVLRPRRMVHITGE
jgi:hypothetical protein